MGVTIERSGHAAYHGERSIELSGCSVRWNTAKKSVTIYSSGVKDFSTEAKHDYLVILPLAELGEIINALGKKGVEECSADIGESMRGQLPSILRLIKSSI